MSEQSKMVFPRLNYDSAEVCLIGIPLSPTDVTKPSGEVEVYTDFTDKIRLTPMPVTQKMTLLAVIYGYSYEGHIYVLDRPKIMTVPIPSEQLGKDSWPMFVNNNIRSLSAHDEMDPRVPRLWRVRKHQRVAEISIVDGAVETLVLEANLPGNRAATTYRSTIQLAHSQGQITR